MWTDQQWHIFVGLVDEAWPGALDDKTARSWRTLLDGINPDVAAEGIRRLLVEGHRFRPSVSEVLAAARRDPTRPTFAEAYQLIYGRRGALAAREPHGVYSSEGDVRRARRAAQLGRAEDLHPLVATFIDRQGVDRLGQIPVNDPDWGEKHRRDLEKAWDQHVDAMDGREVATLAAGGRRGELARFDPLTALGVGSARQQLTEGDAE